MRIRDPGWKNSDPGPGMGKVGSGIWDNIPDPQHWWAVDSFCPVVRGIKQLIIITFPHRLLCGESFHEVWDVPTVGTFCNFCKRQITLVPNNMGIRHLSSAKEGSAIN
jgi:hypothetical protein